MHRTSILLLCCLVPLLAQAQPRHVYLTWQGSTATTMTVNAQTADPDEELTVYYDTVTRGGEIDAYRYRARGTAHQIEGLPDGRWIHWIELTGLAPDTPYAFVVGSSSLGFSEERAFRTLPDDDRPVRFVTGGDLGVGAEVDSLLGHAAVRSPRFALIGGDIAYVNGNLDRVYTWDVWLDAWETYMVTPEGYTIPMVLAVGNHEVQGGYNGGPERAPFYMGFFAQSGQPSYFRLQMGANFAVYALDTGHIVPHGTQVEWLTEQLQADQDLLYRFASYHIPLYPSHRPYDGASSQFGRTHWGPLFDRYELTAAFENHDHTFKRSRILRAGAVADNGTLYLGDGAWGRGGRTVSLTRPWYLAKSGANRHVWVVDVTTEGVSYRAFDTSGRTFDVYPADAPGSTQAAAYFRTMPQLYALGPGALAVTPLEPVEEAFEGAAVRATVKNTEGYPATVEVCFETEAPLRVDSPCTDLTLGPGDASELVYDLIADSPVGEGLFPHAAIRADFAFAREPGDTARVELVQRVAAERAFTAPLRESVTVDGVLDEWSALPYTFEEAAPFEGGTGGWQGPDDASLRFAVVHDGERLYLALRVTDDRVTNVPGTPVWDAGTERVLRDGVLLWLDPHPGGEGNDDPYLAIGADVESATADVIAGDDDYTALAASARAAVRRLEGGYGLEVSVPLASLPGEGPVEAVRLNFAISDLDEAGGTPDVILWRPRWESEYDYEGFGVVRLEDR